MSAELQWLGVAETARRVGARDVRAIDVLDDVLAWIARTEPVVHNYVAPLADAAVREAEDVDRRIAAGEHLPLAGVTYSVKDLIAVRDAPLRAGSKATGAFVSASDAHVIARLRAAGAVCLGKVSTLEFALSAEADPSRNPWDGESTSGGSSSGSGSAVAAGQGHASLGTDCGGSVRIPSALNGVTGIRPTYGLVSTTGVVPLSMTMETVGPLARSVDDVALLLGAMAGFDADDPTSVRAPEWAPDGADAGDDVAGMKVGVPENYFFDQIEDEVGAAVRDAIEVLAGLGMEIRPIRLPHAHYGPRADVAIVYAESATLLADLHAERASELGQGVQAALELGSLVTAKEYLQAQQARTLIRHDFADAFAAVDVIAAPVVAATAKRLPTDGSPFTVTYADGTSEDGWWAYVKLTLPASLAGIPSLVVPCGFANGLPTGMQLIAPAFAERTAFRVGRAFQRATDFHQRRPTGLRGLQGDQPPNEAPAIA